MHVTRVTCEFPPALQPCEDQAQCLLRCPLAGGAVLPADDLEFGVYTEECYFLLSRVSKRIFSFKIQGSS